MKKYLIPPLLVFLLLMSAAVQADIGMTINATDQMRVATPPISASVPPA